jgi:hypothetical protein
VSGLEYDDSDGWISTGDDGAYPASDGSDDQAGQCICIEWDVPTTVGNVIQSDSVEFDIGFGAVQSRNVSDPASENPFVDAILTSDDGWITAEVSAGPTTAVNVALDGDVYGLWPDNTSDYAAEVQIDSDGDGLGSNDGGNTDDFRFKYGASGEQDRSSVASTDGGVIKSRNNAGGFNLTAEEDAPGFSVSETLGSGGDANYTFVINWDTLSVSEAPDDPNNIVVNEVFCVDAAGNNFTPDSTTGSSGTLDVS